MASLIGDTADKRSVIFRLATGCSASAVAIAILSVVVLILVMRDVRDWFVPPTGAGFLRPGELTDGYVANEAQAMVMLQNNWTHETLGEVQKAFELLLDPPLRKTYKEKTAPEERKAVKESKIVLSQFIYTGTDVLRRDGQMRRVLVHGIRTLYINSTPSSEAVTIDLGLEPDTATGRPRGLKIMRVVPSHPLKVAGR